MHADLLRGLLLAWTYSGNDVSVAATTSIGYRVNQRVHTCICAWLRSVAQHPSPRGGVHFCERLAGICQHRARFGTVCAFRHALCGMR